MNEITQEDLNEIAKAVQAGYIEGIVDNEEFRTSWSIEINKFEN